MTGDNSGSASLGTKNNNGNTVTVDDIVPTTGGEIVLRVQVPRDKTWSGIAYGAINFVQIDSSPAPEPASLALLALGGLALLPHRRNARRRAA